MNIIRIQKVHYNWCVLSDEHGSSDDYQICEVGKRGVVSIQQDSGKLVGPESAVCAHYENGSIETIGNINYVLHVPEVG